jgi:hypothetical protein
MFVCRREILDAGIRREEIGRLLQPVGDRARKDLPSVGEHRSPLCFDRFRARLRACKWPVLDNLER